CHQTLFAVEQAAFVQSKGLNGKSATFLRSYWLTRNQTGHYYDMAYKFLSGSCNPREQLGNKSRAATSYVTLAAEYCIRNATGTQALQISTGGRRIGRGRGAGDDASTQSTGEETEDFLTPLTQGWVVLDKGCVTGDPPEPPVDPGLMDPRIIMQPQDLTVFDGAQAQFSVLAEGSPPLTYELFWDGDKRRSAADGGGAARRQLSHLCWQEPEGNPHPGRCHPP